MNRIRQLRLEHGMQQKELAEKLKIGANSVSRYETEQRQLDPMTIAQICDLFGCTSDYLLCRSDVAYARVSDADAMILEAYHALPPEIRQAVDGLLEPYKNLDKEKSAVS